MISGESDLFKDAELASLAEESLARVMKIRAQTQMEPGVSAHAGNSPLCTGLW
jgi:hypothetical protein